MQKALTWLFLVAWPPTLSAAWISIVRQDYPLVATNANFQEDYWTPEGATLRLQVTAEKPSDPRAASLAVSCAADEIVWAGLISARTAGLLKEGIILQGQLETKEFQLSEIIPLPEEKRENGKIDPPPSDAAASQKPLTRSTWAWKSLLWQQTSGALLDRLQAQHIHTVYITVPIRDDFSAIEDEAGLRRFLAAATERHIQTWVVEGDPHTVLPSEREKFVRRVRLYADYNRRAPTSGRFAGIQYDIEHYLVKGYGLDREGWNSAYVETLTLLKAAAEMPLQAAVPYWFAWEKTLNGSLLEDLAHCTDGVVVMDYRTEEDLIRQFAQPFLAWGTRHKRGVRIALESGPLTDEDRRVYRPHTKGELWLLSVEGNRVLVLLKRKMSNPNGPAFAFSHASRFSASKLTFHDDLSPLDSLLPRLEEFFRVWPAFEGMGLHGLPLE